MHAGGNSALPLPLGSESTYRTIPQVRYLVAEHSGSEVLASALLKDGLYKTGEGEGEERDDFFR